MQYILPPFLSGRTFIEKMVCSLQWHTYIGPIRETEENSDHSPKDFSYSWLAQLVHPAKSCYSL